MFVNRYAVGAFAILLVLPTLALLKLSGQVDVRIPLGIVGVASLVTWFLYRSDKRSAQAGEWRTPESTLHLAALLGGWPGAFLAQRVFRHKTSKLSFQFAYWSGVTVYQCVALDYLLDWKFVNQAIAFLPR